MFIISIQSNIRIFRVDLVSSEKCFGGLNFTRLAKSAYKGGVMYQHRTEYNRKSRHTDGRKEKIG